jgi:hypothetical protein
MQPFDGENETLAVRPDEKRVEHCGERIQNLSGRNQCRGTENDEDSTRKTKHRQQQLERMENSLLEQQNEESTDESRWETKILATQNRDVKLDLSLKSNKFIIDSRMSPSSLYHLIGNKK